MLCRIEDAKGAILKNNFHDESLPRAGDIIAVGAVDYEVKYVRHGFMEEGGKETPLKCIVVGATNAPKGTRAAHGKKAINE